LRDSTSSGEKWLSYICDNENLQGANGIKEKADAEILSQFVTRLDVTDNASIAKAISTVICESGRIDVLINNTGYGLVGSFEEMSIEELKAQDETKVFGVFRVKEAVLPNMRKQHGGSINNIISIAGHIALQLYSSYVIIKFAIDGLTVM
jgi:NAD(P)-dependent dehydrogenase (short-subunit alcohol dehydrogenase family)